MLILEDFRDGSRLSEIEMTFQMDKLSFEEVYSADVNFPKEFISRKNGKPEVLTL